MNIPTSPRISDEKEKTLGSELTDPGSQFHFFSPTHGFLAKNAVLYLTLTSFIALFPTHYFAIVARKRISPFYPRSSKTNMFIFQSHFFKVATMATILFTPSAAEYFLGSLTNNKDFDLTGDVYLMSDRVLEVRGFHYKGGAPDPFFWADEQPLEPSQQGFILQDSSPTTSCGSVIIPATSTVGETVTYRLEFPDGQGIHNVLGGTISLWCRAMYVNLGSIDVPETLPDDVLDTQDADLVCSGEATDRFSLYDRMVKPIGYLLGGLWGGVTNFIVNPLGNPGHPGNPNVDVDAP